MLFNRKSLRIFQRLLKTASEIPHFLLVEAFLGFQGTRWERGQQAFTASYKSFGKTAMEENYYSAFFENF